MPPVIVWYSADAMRYPVTVVDLICCDLSGTRLQVIRTQTKIDASDNATREAMERPMCEVPWSRGDLVDLINIVIEEFMLQRFEPPA